MKQPTNRSAHKTKVRTEPGAIHGVSPQQRDTATNFATELAPQYSCGRTLHRPA